jgi:hypothetical protein
MRTKEKRFYDKVKKLTKQSAKENYYKKNNKYGPYVERAKEQIRKNKKILENAAKQKPIPHVA